jgi:hypothetical protein
MWLVANIMVGDYMALLKIFEDTCNDRKQERESCNKFFSQESHLRTSVSMLDERHMKQPYPGTESRERKRCIRTG